MRTIIRNASKNLYGFDDVIFTIASILHSKVQEMSVVIKIDRQFNINKIMNMLVDAKHKFVTGTNSFIHIRKIWRYIYSLNWKVTGVSINKMVLQHSEVLLSLSIVCKTIITKIEPGGKIRCKRRALL